MPWTEITRPDYDRCGLRYASDVTDAEWALIQHFMPERAKTGRPRRCPFHLPYPPVFMMQTTKMFTPRAFSDQFGLYPEFVK